METVLGELLEAVEQQVVKLNAQVAADTVEMLTVLLEVADAVRVLTVGAAVEEEARVGRHLILSTHYVAAAGYVVASVGSREGSGGGGGAGVGTALGVLQNALE